MGKDVEGSGREVLSNTVPIFGWGPTCTEFANASQNGSVPDPTLPCTKTALFSISNEKPCQDVWGWHQMAVSDKIHASRFSGSMWPEDFA